MAERNKVAFLTPDMAAAGTQRVQVMLAGGMAGQGLSVDLVSCRGAGPLNSAIADGVTFYELKHSRFPGNLIQLCRYLKRAQPKTLYSAMNGTNLLALLAVRLSGVKTQLVMTVHTHFGDKWKHRFHATAPVRRWIFKYMYRQAHHVITVSDDIREHLLEDLHLPPGRVSTILNPIDRDRILQLADNPVPHPWLDDTSVPVVAAVGRLVSQKDFPTLLKALNVVLDRRPIRLVIVGEGPERRHLEGMIADWGLEECVLLAGFQPNPYAWISRAQLLALTSLSEGFGLVLMEALALSVPVVATDCGTGPRKIAGLFRNARLVPTANPAAIAEAIELSLGQPPEDEKNSPVWEQFEPEVVAKAYLSATEISD